MFSKAYGSSPASNGLTNKSSVSASDANSIQPLTKYVGVEWLQFVPFVEIGRVAPVWNFERLHSDMKWSAGFGIRALAKGIVIRIDTAVSDEQVGVQMMISQPFQF